VGKRLARKMGGSAQSCVVLIIRSLTSSLLCSKQAPLFFIFSAFPTCCQSHCSVTARKSFQSCTPAALKNISYS